MDTPTEEREIDPDAGWPPFVAQWVLPYVRDSMLWPVLLALLGHLWVALGGLMVSSVRDGDNRAQRWLVGVAVLSLVPIATELRAIRRPGGLTVVVVGSWVLAAIIGYAAMWAGLY